MSEQAIPPVPVHPLLGTLLFSVLAVAAVAFNISQTRVVVIRAASQPDKAARAFDAGMRAGFGPRARVDVRSLRITTPGNDPAKYCESVLYAIDDLQPSLLVAVGEKAEMCLARSAHRHDTPALLVGAGVRPEAANFASVMPLLPRQTWIDALQSQMVPGRPFRVLYLAADSAAGRAEQAQFSALAVPGVSVSTSLVADWHGWQAAVASAQGKADLLVIGTGRTLLALPAGWDDAKLVAHTRATFRAPIAATDVEAVGHGAGWAIATDPHGLGAQAAAAGLALLEPGSTVQVPPPIILIAIDGNAGATHQPLPPLFEAVARHQGHYLQSP